ncbi:hypothetical protein OAT10_05090, partial [Luminiphilus sp.]|nr:hypothetical protein [Luminiphilus sp.]
YYEQEDVLFGFKEFGASLASLDKKMSVFSRLSKSQQKELAQMNAEMTKIGVTNFPEIMDHMTRAMGRTPEEAKRVSASLITFARDLKVPADIMMNDYANAAGDLAKYGGQMETQFKKLAATAKTTGISVSELLSISGKFDTYSDGARAVAGLNAILGGAYLNSVDMLKKGEEERIEAIAESIRMSGVLEKEGDKYVRMALSQQLGAKDVGRVLRLVNKDSKEYLENQKKAAREKSFAKSMEALKTAAISATPVIERINLLIKRIFTPEGGAEKILDILEGQIIPALGKVASVVDGLVEKYGLLGIIAPLALIKVIGLFAAYAKGAASAAGASTIMSSKLTKAGANVGKSAGKMGVGFLKLAVGIIAVGAGIALAGLGMKMLFDSLGENIEKIAPHVMTLFPLAAGILAIAGAMMALSPMALLGVIGMAAFSKNISGLAEALNELPEGILDPKNGLTRLLEVTTEITSENVDNIKDIVEKANSYHKSVIEVQAKGGDTIVDAVKSAGSAGGPSTTGQPIHIHVEIGGKKLETIIIDAINNKKKGQAYGF